MDSFEEIKGLTGKHVELLEAAGYLEPSSLKNSTVDELHDEVSKANEMLSILKESPSRKEVAGWWNQVDGDVDVFAPLGEQSKTRARGERVASVSSENAPIAIPISPNFAKKKEIDFAKLPRAGEEIYRSEAGPSAAPAVTKAMQPRNSYKESATAASKPTVPAEFKKERVLSMDEFREGGGKVAPLARAAAEDLTKMTRAETNQGVNPTSRRYIRGVLHKEPKRVMFSAFCMLLAVALAVGSVLLTPLIFWDKEVFFWAVFAPLLGFLGLVIWFLFARSAACPVCRQRQFMPKACLKHVKAHRIPMLGYMVSTAIHILGFRWFRCIFCGTSIRLKE